MSKWRPEGWKNPYMGKVGGDLGNVHEAGADAMLEAVCQEIEKVENLYDPIHAGLHYHGFETARKKILARLRSKGQPVGPGMWGECPSGPTGAEGPPGLLDKVEGG